MEKIINRKQYEYLLDDDNFNELKNLFILITGANGSIGKRLIQRFHKMGVSYVATDIDSMDITNENEVENILLSADFDLIINIAGAKHAPKGEVEVESTLNTNTIGVLNLLKYKKEARLILTSTCKSCNPETVYGATKLISERLTLNSGGSVARFYNVVETDGNVFQLWEQQNTKKVVTKCNRYFISLDESVGLIMHSCLNKGRFAVNTQQIHNMKDIYKRIYNEPYEEIEPRKGDRVTELLHSTNEWREPVNEAVVKINNYFDCTN